MTFVALDAPRERLYDRLAGLSAPYLRSKTRLTLNELPPATMQSRPPLLAGRPIPFLQLDPNSFENFSFAALCLLSDSLALRIDGQPSGTGDGGFDVIARRKVDGALVCIQCKRYEIVGMPVLTEELAKVALRSAIDGQTVVAHYFFAAGRIRRVVQNALREPCRTQFIAGSKSRARDSAELENLRVALTSAGQGSPDQVAEAYVAGLEELKVWGGIEFDNLLGTIWSSVQGILERWFAIETVCREYPRPDFDVAAYRLATKESKHESWIPLLGVDSALPPGLFRNSAANPSEHTHDGNADTVSTQTERFNVVDELTKSNVGTITLVVGPGGAGKTTALLGAASEVASENEDLLPVYLQLGSYRGDLSVLVHRALKVTRGHWTSIPGNFLLLCDGLNELSRESLAVFVSELNQLISVQPCRVAVAISTRESSSERVVIPSISRSIVIEPLSPALVEALARPIVSPIQLQHFMEAYTQKLDRANFSNLFILPFGVAAAASAWTRTQQLPETASELLEDLLASRFERNREVLSRSETQLPRTLVDYLSREFARSIILERGLLWATQQDAETAVMDALRRARVSGIYGSDVATSTMAFDALIHFERLKRNRSNEIGFTHQLVGDYYAAVALSANWRDYVERMGEPELHDIWVFAAGKLYPADLDQYLGLLATQDIWLATRAAEEAKALPRIEERALSAAKQASSVYGLSAAFMALSRIGSHDCMALCWSVIHGNESEDRTWFARRALATFGDLTFLKRVWEKIDHEKSDRYIRISGGDHGLIASIPISTRLRLARDRIASGADDVDASLEVLGNFGDVSDVGRISEVLARGIDELFPIAHWALKQLDPELAQKAFQTEFEKASGKHLVRILAWRDGPLSEHEQERLFEFAFSEIISDLSPEEGHGLHVAQSGALKILKRQTRLADTVARRCVSLYDARPTIRWECWSLARSHSIEDFASRALIVFTTPVWNELAPAAWFAKSWLSESGVAQELLGAALTLKVPANLWGGRGGAALAAYIASRGRESDAALIVEHHLRMFQKIASDAKLSEHDIHVPQVDEDDAVIRAAHKRFRLGDLIVPWIEPLSMIAKRIPQDLRLFILELDITHRGELTKELYQAVFADISISDVDDALQRVDDAVTRLANFRMLASLGVSDWRLEVISKYIRESHWGNAIRAALEVVRETWSKAVATLVVNALTRRDWGDDASEEYSFSSNNSIERDFRDLSDLFDGDLIDEVVTPALAQCKSNNGNRRSIRILQLWSDVAVRRAPREARKRPGRR